MLEPGDLVAGDPLTVVARPDHGVRVRDLYRAMTSEPRRWPAILAAAGDDLSADAREMGEAGTTYAIG